MNVDCEKHLTFLPAIRTTESVLQYVRFCLPLYSLLSILCPHLLFPQRKSPSNFLEIHYAEKFGTRDKQLSLKPHFSKMLCIIQFETTSWERDVGHFFRHPQATLLKTSFNISKLQSGVRYVCMDSVPFILYMWAWENSKFKHPKVMFSYILWLHFFLYSFFILKYSWLAMLF